MSLGAFQIDIQRFVDKANGNVDLVVRKVALDLFSRVIEKSPVDTGRFKSNWQVAINSIPSGTLATEDKSGGATITRVATEVLDAKGGDIITMVNNLDYAHGLEYGKSKQAPAGMVRTSIEEYSGVVAQAVSEVPK